MKKLKILLLTILLLPIIAVAQSETNKWLTPYANVEFSDSMITYSVSLNAVTGTIRLLPKYYDKRMLQVIMTPAAGNVSSNDVFRSWAAIKDYLDTKPVTLRSNVEQEEYLKLSVMVILWEEKLSTFSIEEIKKMKTGNDTKISKYAGQTMQLLETYSDKKL